MANEKTMYKCCWNCENGFTVATNPEEEEKRINASKRMCCANYPVSNRLQNPFQQRYCKQFVPDYIPKKGHFIDKKEAEKLGKMSADELLEYWRN
jgi:hypothetical protein